MKTQTGQQGEQLAANYLQGQGYTILARNWRCRYGEIDIIARKGNLITFVEVRTRHADTTDEAFASINRSKQAKMRKAVLAYLQTCPTPDAIWQVDIIGVALPRFGNKQPAQIEHVEDALGWE